MFYFGIKGIPGGYSYLSFGEGDEKLIGDDVKSDILKSPTTIYAGEGSEEGFNFVQVSFICLKTMHNDAEFTHGLHLVVFFMWRYTLLAMTPFQYTGKKGTVR